jgi:NAD(P) transhydrogenase subunit beta
VFIGAVTFTGSIVAYLKLSAKIKSCADDAARAQCRQPRHHRGLVLGMTVAYVSPRLTTVVRQGLLGVMTLLALFLGWHLVASIGGGDMPVVVSMLNSYSGWAAAAAGFLLNNDLLIITGALVGSSGAYLSYIMCKAMNRSFISVIAGGFGSEAGRWHRRCRTTASTARSTPKAWPNCCRTPTRSSSPPATAWPWRRPSTRSPT